MNVAVELPAGIVRDAGTAATEVMLDESVILTPPVPAGPFRATVPVEGAPPVTTVGLRLIETNANGLTVRVEVLEIVPFVAVIFAATELETVEVVIVKLAEVDPAGTVTVAGVWTLDVLHAKLTDAPPAGAGPFRATVPEAESPPTTDAGEMTTDVNASAEMERVAVTDAEPIPAVIVAEAEFATAVVEITNEAVVEPPATVTLAGTDALLLLDDRLTFNPLVGACPFKVMVPDDGAPPRTDVGESVRLMGTGEVIARDAAADVAPTCAVIFAESEDETADVVTVNVAATAPGETITLAGSAALVLFDDRVTAVPPVGAGPLRVTVPCDGFPPITEAGDKVTLVGTAGLIVNFAEAEVDPIVAVIVATVTFDTGTELTVNEARVDPAGTETLEGRDAATLLDAKLTTSPPVGAGPFNVIVPIEEVPPTTKVGANVKPFGTGEVTVRVVATTVAESDAESVATVEVETADVETVKLAAF